MCHKTKRDYTSSKKDVPYKKDGEQRKKVPYKRDKTNYTKDFR